MYFLHWLSAGVARGSLTVRHSRRLICHITICRNAYVFGHRYSGLYIPDYIFRPSLKHCQMRKSSNCAVVQACTVGGMHEQPCGLFMRHGYGCHAVRISALRMRECFALTDAGEDCHEERKSNLRYRIEGRCVMRLGLRRALALCSLWLTEFSRL